MRVLVIGAGALGGYYGACVVRAGGDVTFLVRAKRAEQVLRDGLQVVSPHGDFAVQPKIIQASDLKEPYDVVLVGVKSYSLDDAMSQFAPAVGADTMILPILNGLKHIDALTARFGASRVLGGLANVSAGLDPDGRVVQFMANQTIVFGEIKGPPSERTLALEKLLQVAGIDVRASEAIIQDMWEKFVQLSTLAGARASETFWLCLTASSPFSDCLRNAAPSRPRQGLSLAPRSSSLIENSSRPWTRHSKLRCCVISSAARTPRRSTSSAIWPIVPVRSASTRRCWTWLAHMWRPMR